MAVTQECLALATRFHGSGRLFEEFLRKMAHFVASSAEGKREACSRTASPLPALEFVQRPLTLVCFDAD